MSVDLSHVRVLPGRHGTWVDDGHQAVLVSEDFCVDPPSPRLVEALRCEGLTSRRGDTYAVTVVSTTRCNLVCDYCFQADVGETGPVRIPPVSVTDRGIEDMTSFVAHQMAATGRSAVDLLITGGEPLLSFVHCCELLRCFGALGMSAAQMFTNGALLTSDRAVRLSELGLSRVQVSLDGDRAEHDRYRRDASGRGTYEKVLANLRVAARVAPDLELVVRVNVSATNIPSIVTLIDDLQDRVGPEALELRFGLLDDIGVGFTNAPLRTDATMAALADVMVEAVDRGFFVAPLASVAGCQYCSVPAGGTGCVINADGTLYSCWESVGRAGYEVGTVVDGYLDASVLVDRWVDCSFNVVADGLSTGWMDEATDRIDARVLDRMYERSLTVGATA